MVCRSVSEENFRIEASDYVKLSALTYWVTNCRQIVACS